MLHSVLALLLAPIVALAQTDCPIPYLSKWGCGTGGFEALAGKLNASIIPASLDIFLGLIFLMTLVYSLALIVGSQNEDSISEGRRAFLFAVAGGAIVFFRETIYSAVAPGSNAIVSAGRLNPIFEAALGYLTVIGAAAAIGFVTIRALRLITAGGDESAISSQRKLFLNAVVGVGVLLLADSIVNAAFPGGSEILAAEATGIANYVLYVLGALLVLGIFVGGVLMIFSYDEGMQDRAKKAIFGSVVVLVVLVCLGAIINLVL